MKIGSKVLIAMLTFGYIVLLLTGKINGQARLAWPEFALIVFVVLVVGDFFDRLSELSFGKEGLHIITRIEDKQKAQAVDLAAVRIALSGLVTKYEYAHLAGLNATGAYGVRFGNIFFEEIKRLDAIGFVKVTERNGRGFNAIREDHESNQEIFDLKDYMQITDEGRVYLQARTRVSALTESGDLLKAQRAAV